MSYRVLLRLMGAAFLYFTISFQSWAGDMNPPADNWNKVQNLVAGADVSVKLNNGTSVSGDLVQLKEGSLLVMDGSNEREFPRSAISEISLIHRGSRARKAAITGGIVGAAAFGIGYAIAPVALDNSKATAGERATLGAAMGGIWGGIGAGIAAVRKPRVKEEVIYTSKASLR